MLHPEMERFRVMRDQVHTEELEKECNVMNLIQAST